MKKILSVALSTAMAFSMFASVAFGADAKMTDEQQFQALKTAGVMSGDADGLSHLDRALTRAELAKIIVKTMNLTPVDATSYKDKNYAKHWGRTYIEAATQAGILNGKDATKKLFDPNGKVTVQELAKVLVTAMKLEVPKDANNTASAWAKGYVAAAVKAGYLADGINYQAQATRSQAVVAAYAIYDASQGPKVTKYEVKDSKNIEFTLSTGEVVKVTLEKALERNKATDVTFKTKDGKEIKTSVTWNITSATKVESVKSTNLKEVLVTFDGDVKKEDAEKITNYKLDDATLNAASIATLQADGKSVLINLGKEGPVLTNQRTYQLKVSGISGITAGSFSFTTLDVSVPEVSAVEILGNKVLNVTFNEPVKVTSAETRVNYKLDGYVVNGNIEVSKDGKTATITLYTRLKAGTHKVSVSGVQDYANMTIINYLDKEITVADDTTAPASFTVESATLDEATIKFDEAVDKDTVTKAINDSKIYWSDNAGTTKYTASKAVPTDSKFTTYKVTFSSNKLPARDTTLYVESVSDLFGNTAAKLSAKINATVDVTRPEIASLQPTTDQYGQFTPASSSKFDVKFNKSIAPSEFSSAKSNNLVVKDSDGKIVAVANGAVEKADATNTLVVTLSNALTEGKTYTVEVKDVVDSTALNNKIIPVTFTITVPQVTAPVVRNVSVADAVEGTKIQVVYSNAMALDGEYSILKSDRYMIKINGSWYLLPTGTTFQPTYDSKAVIITVPKDAKYDGTSTFTSTSVQGVKVTLVADQNGNKLSGLTKEVVTTDTEWGAITAAPVRDKVYATAKDTIKVVFDRPLQVAYASDFLVNGVPASSASYETVDGKGEVTLKLASSLSAATTATVTTKPQTDIRSLDLLGNKIPTFDGVAPNPAVITVLDGVAPSVTSVAATASNQVTVTFDEKLSTTLAPAQIAANFVVKTGLNQDTVLVPGTDYSAAIGTNPNEHTVVLTFTKALNNVQKMTVATNDNAVYIFDANGVTLNGIAKANKIKFDAKTVDSVGLINVVAAASDASATSTDYLVGATSITNVPFNTSVATLLSKLSVQTGATVVVKQAGTTVISGATVVATGDTVTVTSADATATKTYNLTVTVASNVATVSTTAAGYDVAASTVIAPTTATVADLKAALTAAPGATFIITDNAGVERTTGTDVLAATDKVKVTAQDGTVKTYTIALQ